MTCYYIKVDELVIDICQADKRGAILIVPGNYLEEKIEAKVKDTDKYEALKSDIRPLLYDTLIDQWRYGLHEDFVTDQEAKQVVGITANMNKSTASRFKHGKTYFVPSLKIHKCNSDDLKPYLMHNLKFLIFNLHPQFL